MKCRHPTAILRGTFAARRAAEIWVPAGHSAGAATADRRTVTSPCGLVFDRDHVVLEAAEQRFHSGEIIAAEAGLGGA
jgi:hypothetical protein